ncbi:hypothetical protein TNCV_2574071 [Trichonephila clavipes]|nr:hypothetical protein TNCV_2574071 [Trichonephila clavipes]
MREAQSRSIDCRRQTDLARESGNLLDRPENIQEKDRYPTRGHHGVGRHHKINGRTHLLRVVPNGTQEK